MGTHGNFNFDVIIIGGSYAGLSAGMALGRSLRRVLIIDAGRPCNRQTPLSHNFLTQDGKTPLELSQQAEEQVLQYDTVTFYSGLVMEANKTAEGYTLQTDTGATFTGKKLIFATGVKDIMPDIKGFAACWGISVIHCPYCHGYEVRQEKTAILANGDMAFEYAKLISNWTKSLVVLTNGVSTLNSEHIQKLKEHHIRIIETPIKGLEHDRGYLQYVMLEDGTQMDFKAIYARPNFVQASSLPVELGCELTESGHLKVDAFQRTTIPGIYACGDNTVLMRSVAQAVASGSFAGAIVNKEMIEEEF